MAIDNTLNEKSIEMGRGYINGGFTSNTTDEKVRKGMKFIYFMNRKKISNFQHMRVQT